MPPGPDALRVSEVLDMPARWLAHMPAGVTLLLVAGGVPIVVTTSAADYARAGTLGGGTVRMHGAELAALVASAEYERLTCAELLRWLAAKQATPTWELTEHVTLGAAVNVSRHYRLTLRVRSVLHACGARMVAVAADAPAPAAFWASWEVTAHDAPADTGGVDRAGIRQA